MIRELVAVTSVIAALQAPTGQAVPAQAMGLRVEAVKFEPVRQGRNVVRVTVKNTGQRSELFAVWISAESPDYERGLRMIWDTGFDENIRAAETKDLRFVYRLYGPVTDNTAISLSFFNPPSRWMDPAFLLERRWYYGRDLPRATASTVQPVARAADSERAAVVEVLQHTQQDLKANRYREAWQSFSKDLCVDYHCETDEEFVIHLRNASAGLYSPLWSMDRFIAFDPGPAMKSDDGRVVLLGGSSDPDLKVYFTHEDGRWKIDDIGGHVSQADLWATWEQRLLPKMESRQTEHFDLLYAPGSTAAKEAERIASEREAVYRAVVQLFGVPVDIRTRLVFFEDRDAKARETGQNADVWAYDQTVVQVFNPVVRPDPFLEVCYLLADTIGNPPPVFKEGVAAYLKERTGPQASTGGGEVASRIDARVREIRARNALIGLDALVRAPVFRPLFSSFYTPGQLDSSIAIPESVSFVKFLVEQFGKEKFLEAYKTLKNTASGPYPPDSRNAAIQDANIRALERIYGMSLSDLEARWLKAVGQS